VYGVRLVGASMRWPEFAWLLAGLFVTEDSRLRRTLFPPKSDESDEGEGE
jgi:hypothetical protein